MKVETITSLTSSFYTSLFSDALACFPDYGIKSANLDQTYILTRIRSEGDSFVSRILPKLGKAAETSLITNSQIVIPQGFNLMGKTRLPVLLNYFFKGGWDEQGYPRFRFQHTHTDDCKEFASKLFFIRQVLMAYSKVSDMEPETSNEEAIASFVARVQEDPKISAPGSLLSRARALLREILMDGEELSAPLAQWDTMPFGRHGPGAVAGKEQGCEKWDFGEIPGTDPNLYQWRPGTHDWNDTSDPVARLTAVPKDFRGPRIICIEPKEFQFAQQGLMDVLYSLIMQHPLTRHSINFNRQEKSQHLCRRLDLATIDLKDASDRVSLKLCRLLFPKRVFSLLTRYRSREIMLPDESTIKPTCFASMGNALCFPVETLVFWAIARAAMLEDSKAPIRVFGDDIIVPFRHASTVVAALESCGLVINPSKTCINTLVRESCGAWLYDGFDVSVTRFKHRVVSSAESWWALCEQAKIIYDNGLHNTSIAMLELLDSFAPISYGFNGFPFIPGRKVRNQRYNRMLQRLEVRVPAPFAGRGNISIPDYAGLYAWQVGNDTHPSPFGTVKVKWGWVAMN